MRVKIFNNTSYDSEKLEQEMNNWLKDNESIEVIKIIQNTEAGHNRITINVFITIFYNERAIWANLQREI